MENEQTTPELRVRATRTVEVEEEYSGKISELSLIVPTPTREGVLVVVFGAREDDGDFRTDVPFSTWRIEGATAAGLIDLLFSAQITHGSFAGMTVLQAGSAIIAQDLARRAAPEEANVDGA